MAKSRIRNSVRSAQSRPDIWRFRWPNTADFNFNYYHLLDLAMDSAIAENSNPELRIAIIGAGVAGLVAARELFRCGYTRIDIYEASPRIGGRTYSVPVEGQHTTLEMGAMRMPFFDHVTSQNCVLDYYRKLFSITTQDFPDPGSSIADTGVWVNGGFGPDPEHPMDRPTLLIWKKENEKPPTDKFVGVFEKWDKFSKLFKGIAATQYGKGRQEWEGFWQSFVQNYWKMSFRDFVHLKEIESYNSAEPGYFGGLGMNQEQASLFYVIGAGDGSWGAFYDISCLFPVRTLLCGFALGHQLIQGKFGPDGNYAPGPRFERGRPTDSLGYSLEPPVYLGVQSFADCLFYERVKSRYVEAMSLYEAMQETRYDINLYTRNGVRTITCLADRKLRIDSAAKPPDDYDAVIITAPTWALQMSINFEGFDAHLMPFSVRDSVAVSHWITSCKVFFPLTRRYWEERKVNGDPVIPQVMVTDTFLQGVYGYGVTTKAFADPGVLLASYTWEDDANKLLASDSDEMLARRCLRKLDDTLARSRNRPISPYVRRDQPTVIFWAKQPTYRGCAKLTRSRSWEHDYALLRYNQDHSRGSGLYCCGEAYSVEGGWVEPALRMALDAVIHLAHNNGAKFVGGFNYSDYPRYSSWNP